MRLDKLLAHCDYGSRKTVKSYIRQGLVCVNGTVIKKDDYHVDGFHDKIMIDGEYVHYEKYIYYMLNKPAGYISATHDDYYPTVVDLIDDYYRDDLFPIGRLDIDTEGLLILSNDGKLAHELLSPKKHCPKVYFAKINGIVDEKDIDKFLQGIKLEDFTCQSSKLKILNVDDCISEVTVEIYEGKFHQVKRMFHFINKEVIYLKRIQMNNLELDKYLKIGEYRRLTDEELDRLRNQSVIQ
ncbi:MAG: rRNA pseudouridine synthase [Erysipelotrichaceae bacterium]|nr:rRNA pseudouridine synthase [Erysipelotrichaceae bacterium]